MYVCVSMIIRMLVFVRVCFLQWVRVCVHGRVRCCVLVN